MGSDTTEFICEVVRISQVNKHPGADRLDVVQFEGANGPMAYTCVTQHGAFRPGDLAGYLGVDCLIPRGGADHELFDFLFERPESKSKNVHRLRAARLRGVYSEGLLVPVAHSAVLGQDLSERWGVQYYGAPSAEDEAKAGLKPARESRESRVPWFRRLLLRLANVQDNTMNGRMPVYGVASLRKVPNLFTEGEQVLVTEKIHGANIRFGWLDGRFVVGSHRAIKTDTRAGLRGGWVSLALALATTPRTTGPSARTARACTC